MWVAQWFPPLGAWRKERSPVHPWWWHTELENAVCFPVGTHWGLCSHRNSALLPTVTVWPSWKGQYLFSFEIFSSLKSPHSGFSKSTGGLDGQALKSAPQSVTKIGGGGGRPADTTLDPQGTEALCRRWLGQRAASCREPLVSFLEAGQEKPSFRLHVELVLKEYSDKFCLNFPQAFALVFVYYINKYYAANVPIWQGREKSIKMKLWLQLLNTNEGGIYLAW